MNDESMFTDREAVLRERAAFEAGHDCALEMRSEVLSFDATTEAIRRYPLPKVTQYRAIKDPLEWRILWSVRDDVIVGEALDSGHWYPLSSGHSAFLPVSSRVRVWADLLANPTEEVEADA